MHSRWRIGLDDLIEFNFSDFIGDAGTGGPRAVARPQLARIRACPTQVPDSPRNGVAAQRYTLFTTRAGDARVVLQRDA